MPRESEDKAAKPLRQAPSAQGVAPIRPAAIGRPPGTTLRGSELLREVARWIANQRPKEWRRCIVCRAQFEAVRSMPRVTCSQAHYARVLRARRSRERAGGGLFL